MGRIVSVEEAISDKLRARRVCCSRVCVCSLQGAYHPVEERLHLLADVLARVSEEDAGVRAVRAGTRRLVHDLLEVDPLVATLIVDFLMRE